jgi:RNA polymerase sigma factor (sigma-70 family)
MDKELWINGLRPYIINAKPGGNTTMRATWPEAIGKGDKKHIKKALKRKIAVYKPLGFEAAFNGFLRRPGAEGFKALREMPREGDRKAYLDTLIKDFLIENAYYTLEEQYIRRRLMKRLGISDPTDVRFLEMVDFIVEGIERGGLKRLKTFQERCQFKTYLCTVISSLLNDYWREKYKIEKKVTRYEQDFEEMFNRPVDDTAALLIHLEDEKLKGKAAASLPRVLDKLDFRERLVIKLKYQKNMNTSEIARTMDLSRYKARQLIREAEMRIKEEILAKLRNRGGRHGTPEG